MQLAFGVGVGHAIARPEPWVLAQAAQRLGNGQDGPVPVSEALRRLSEDPGFWTGDRVADPDEEPELHVTFPVTSE